MIFAQTRSPSSSKGSLLSRPSIPPRMQIDVAMEDEGQAKRGRATRPEAVIRIFTRRVSARDINDRKHRSTNDASG